jgi:hypothetical protein
MYKCDGCRRVKSGKWYTQPNTFLCAECSREHVIRTAAQVASGGVGYYVMLALMVGFSLGFIGGLLASR